jgi:hypothetical protein
VAKATVGAGAAAEAVAGPGAEAEATTETASNGGAEAVADEVSAGRRQEADDVIIEDEAGEAACSPDA